MDGKHTRFKSAVQLQYLLIISFVMPSAIFPFSGEGFCECQKTSMATPMPEQQMLHDDQCHAWSLFRLPGNLTILKNLSTSTLALHSI
jgi:hypothetical protein